MTTSDALTRIIPRLTDELVIHTTGHICRDSCAIQDRPGNFYMIGSMGLAPAIALGLARARPQRRVVVFDGDGALLMGLGTLAMVATERPENFYHIVFDNEAYASTGYQPTHARQVALDEIARASGYPRGARATTLEALESALSSWFDEPGPALLLVKCQDRPATTSPRIPHTPAAITQRLCAAACR